MVLTRALDAELSRGSSVCHGPTPAWASSLGCTKWGVNGLRQCIQSWRQHGQKHRACFSNSRSRLLKPSSSFNMLESQI